MAQGPSSEDPDVPEWLLAAGRLLGLSPIQTRWKIVAAHRKWRAFRRELEPASRGFEHQICGECGALQPHEAKVCSSCGEKLASPAARVLRKLGLTVPTFLSVSSLLGLAFIVIYFRMMTEWRGQGLMTWTSEALITHGALAPHAVFENGQYWRIGTANFLHIGVWHIFFNISALTQVGPAIEDVFGRARMVFFFFLTGILAMGASALVQPQTLTAGASGALMGLIGVAAGWGHRRKTSQGKAVRDQMIMWAVYTTLFGFIVRANHVAHGGGFVAGGVIGLAFSPHALEKTKGSLASMVMGIVGSLGCGVLILLTLVPPASSREVAARHERVPRGLDEAAELATEGMIEYRDRLRGACKMLDQGKTEQARLILAELADHEVPPDELDGICAFRTVLAQMCDDYRAEGLDGILGPDTPDDQRKFWASYYEVWCAPE